MCTVMCFDRYSCGPRLTSLSFVVRHRRHYPRGIWLALSVSVSTATPFAGTDSVSIAIYIHSLLALTVSAPLHSGFAGADSVSTATLRLCWRWQCQHRYTQALLALTVSAPLHSGFAGADSVRTATLFAGLTLSAPLYTLALTRRLPVNDDRNNHVFL